MKVCDFTLRGVIFPGLHFIVIAFSIRSGIVGVKPTPALDFKISSYIEAQHYGDRTFGLSEPSDGNLSYLLK